MYYLVIEGRWTTFVGVYKTHSKMKIQIPFAKTTKDLFRLMLKSDKPR